MTYSNFKSQLHEALQFGFIDKDKFKESLNAPKVLINNQEERRFVLTDVQEELSNCIHFQFSVAFVTQSGIALIKSQLLDLANKNIRGEILISPYLDFNDPLALLELLKLENVKVRVSPEQIQLHSKFYLFDHGYKQVLISGSSNLTGNALKKNYEWNIKLTSTDNSALIHTTRNEFKRVWDLSTDLTKEWIKLYKLRRQVPIPFVRIEEEQPVEFTGKIFPNDMQKNALKGLNSVRDNGAQKALVISATGTGKTYLSAFDVEQVNPERVLFIVHREQILSKSLESYQRVLGFDSSDACIYRPGMDISGKKYIFAMIQTLSRPEHLFKFDPSLFDYILIDEVHKAGAASYKKVMEYFKPGFLLGMTATPERTDGQNIFELFDYNLAYEIRLQEALDNDLLCPFIYHGVSDILVDGELINENSSFSNLVSTERIKHILKKIDYYGHSGEKVKGLIFCSSKKEATELSNQFNINGLRSKALTGEDSAQVRNETVRELENGQLEYIFTVDIFNEGIDIPSINQVVMLRNTQSSIIFVQQLGRGLRKHYSKEFVTIIDFIGNYKNNYLIPIALFGDQSMNKDNYRREVREANLIKGLTTINFEEIAKEQIFKSISSTTLSSMKILRDSYIEVKNKIGQEPYLIDFLKNNSIDPLVFFENSQFKQYGDVLNKFSDETISLNDTEKKYLEFITFEYLNGKRKHELLLLEQLVKYDGQIDKSFFKKLLSEQNQSTDEHIIRSVEGTLSLEFLKGQEQKRFGSVPLVYVENNNYILNKVVLESLKENPDFCSLFCDVIKTGLTKSELYPDIFTIGQKYSRREVIKLLNFSKDENPQNVGGYKIDRSTNTCPIFVTYHKSDDINESIKYEDKFLNESMISWFSKNKRNFNSPDVKTIIKSNQNGLKMELFVKKDDGEGGDFYYLGPVKYSDGSAKLVEKPEGTSVNMLLQLKNSMKTNLYNYLTTK
ncbi:DUF3427 domain-containing protein [Streptococcus hongkongensis]|nr:helicase [Streptococcus uberis]